MKRLSLLLPLILAAGCANVVPADPAKMTPDQLREWSKDRNANVSCGVVNSPYGRGVMTYVTLDRSVVINGSVTVDNECKVTILSSKETPNAQK